MIGGGRPLLPEILSQSDRVGAKFEQEAQLSQRDRAAGCVIVFAKSRRLELGDNILRTV